MKQAHITPVYEHMKRKELTTDQMAKLCKCSPSTIHRVMYGEVEPRICLALRIARALRVDCKTLWSTE